MSLFSRILGHDGKGIPHDVTITYANGTVGHMPICGADMRSVLKTVDYWLPQQVPAVSVLIQVRESQHETY